jgi:RecG-like helicase
MVRTNDGFEIAEVDLKLRGRKFNGNTTKRCSEPSNRYC